MLMKGRYVIPLPSAPGGANRLAQRIAGLTGGQAVITTATDINHVPAVDVWAQIITAPRTGSQ